MPSREILVSGLERLDALPIRMIAPQHGSIVPERLVAGIVEQLKSLECGLYLMVSQDTDILSWSPSRIVSPCNSTSRSSRYATCS